MNYLGIDWGKAKIGLAMGNDEAKLASPIMTLSFQNQTEILKKLNELINEENIKGLVVGRPISLGGGEKMSEEFERFVKKLADLKVEIYFEDERLTTKYAQSLQKEYKGSKKVSDDEIAAAAILQTFFDKLSA